ncbi:MAG: TIGR00730 family Rossman fold protein [Candidatus Woesearchaeota archaeon]
MVFQKNKQFLKKSVVGRHVKKEIESGLTMLDSIEHNIVTVLGSHVTKHSDADFKHCMKLCNELGKRGYAIASGGGPGIMHAANRGAMKSGAPSIGIKAGLIKNEKVPDNYFTHVASYDYLFVRRFLLSVKSDALLFYPGGYGTLNELFEYITLIETGMADKVPLICVNKKYWRGLFGWLKKGPLIKGMFSNGEENLKLVQMVDDQDEIIKIIEQASREQ